MCNSFKRFYIHLRLYRNLSYFITLKYHQTVIVPCYVPWVYLTSTCSLFSRVCVCVHLWIVARPNTSKIQGIPILIPTMIGEHFEIF